MSTTIIRKRIEKSQRGSEESPIAKWTLTTIALGFVFMFLLLPLINVFYQAFSHGIGAYFDAIKDPDSMAAILAARSRAAAAQIAPPQGLTLVRVSYGRSGVRGAGRGPVRDGSSD